MSDRGKRIGDSVVVDVEWKYWGWQNCWWETIKIHTGGCSFDCVDMFYDHDKWALIMCTCSSLCVIHCPLGSHSLICAIIDDACNAMVPIEPQCITVMWIQSLLCFGNHLLFKCCNLHGNKNGKYATLTGSTQQQQASEVTRHRQTQFSNA